MEQREIEAIVREVLAKSAVSVAEAAPAGRREAAAGTDSLTQTGAGRGWTKAALADADGSRAEDMMQLINANGGKVRTAMPLAQAVKLIEKVEAKAAEWKMRVVTAVSDASGRPVAIHCMDGAYMGSFDVALNKTYTSIAFQMSTAELGKLSLPGESLYGIQFTNEGRIVIFGGGEVLKRDGVIVGALGVSGGSAQQDTDLAAYGRRCFESE